MVIQRDAKFFENQNTSNISNTFVNPQADILTVQVSGGANAFTVAIEGRNSKDADWIPLAGINLTNLSVSTDGITEKGIYEFGIVGIRELRANLKSISGSVSVYGQLISTEET